ncbi:C6 finger domain protein [Penicillium concentricum]|uniref:C6 finger domain protein n=1 Tax=Penicillium concentricum TaxID=293559 RepID=A0A9W9S629_9EURO|nr:C6 finger domain protein [Penicillium concentricum]KAJ5372691.1 C6 finger domain protein [Penicillium concentricum]
MAPAASKTSTPNAGQSSFTPSTMDWNNYTGHTDSHNSPDATNAEFRCGLCNKAYGRRDLRDRHRRRCAKTFGQERPSKRKSCEICAQKKLRCSLTRPACSRCVQMGTACHYPNTSSTSPTWVDQDTGPEHMSPLEVILEPISTGFTPDFPVSAMTLPEDSSSAPGMDGIAWSPPLNDIGFILDGTGFPGQATWPDPGSGFVDYLHDQTSTFLTPQEKSKEPHPLDNHSLLLSRNSPDHSLSPLSSSAESSHREPSMGRDDVETSNSGVSWDTTSIFASSFVPDLSHPALRDTTSLSHELFGILREYSRMMIQPNFWSPFIHHSLYRCSKDGMAEPLGIAVACVSAYSSSVESSVDFVDNMINSQRERLVREFHIYTDRPETCLAALHAVCVYQILGLFGGPSVDSPRSGHSTPFKDRREGRREDAGKAAELHGSFLLKMTRRLCKLHQKALGQNEAGWSEWKFAESLRRNVFFVHIVNILAAEARKLHRDYFEPLNDGINLQMPLPAPEYMWRVCSDAEWQVAREYARTTSPTPGTLQDLLELDRVGGLDVALLQPLTRIILACHKIRAKFNDGVE